MTLRPLPGNLFYLWGVSEAISRDIKVNKYSEAKINCYFKKPTWKNSSWVLKYLSVLG